MISNQSSLRKEEQIEINSHADPKAKSAQNQPERYGYDQKNKVRPQQTRSGKEIIKLIYSVIP